MASLLGLRTVLSFAASVLLIPSVTLALTTEYCSNPPKVDHGSASLRGRGILGYPVGSFAYYECEPPFSSKDGVELYRSCEFNGERAVWSDASSECVPVPGSMRKPMRVVHSPALSFMGGRTGINDAPSEDRDEDKKSDKNKKPSDAVSADDLPATPVVYSSEEDEEEEDDESDDSSQKEGDFLMFSGNPYGNAFPKPPTQPQPGQKPSTGMAIYPAVPLTEHQLTAYAKLPDNPRATVHGDYRDNGPVWTVPVGTHYAPPALNERNRKVRIRMSPNDPRFQQFTSGRLSGPGGDRSNRYPPSDMAWTPFRPQPDPVLSKYAYGCGPAPVIPSARPLRQLQTRYSIGSRVSYKCNSGKYSNVPQDMMQTICVFDDGYAHWTPINAQCLDDFDIEFPEDQKDEGERKKLLGWRLSKEQRPGYITVEKEFEVPPVPAPSPYDTTARISFAEAAPGRSEAKPIPQYPWPLSIITGDDADEDSATGAGQENDRIIVSKTLFLQPPPFPNPPFRRGPGDARGQRRRQNMCDSLEPPVYDPATCRQPPSLKEIAIRSLFQGKSFPKDMETSSTDILSENDSSNIGGYCMAPPPKVPNAELAKPRNLIYPFGAQATYVCRPGYAYENGVAVRTSCYVPFGNQEGVWNPVMGRCVLSQENDWSWFKKQKSGKNPEQIDRPPVQPPSGGHHVNVDLVNDDQSGSGAQPSVPGNAVGQTAQNDERNCVGDECLPGPGPDELESSTTTERFSYEVPPQMVKNGKLALNIFHGNDRKTFAGEGVIRSLGDTGFPFNEMYKQQNLTRSRDDNSQQKKHRPPLEVRAYALSERLMRGGFHGPKSKEPEDEPQVITGIVLGVAGALGVAILLCKCFKCCSKWLPSFCTICPEECDEEGGALADYAGESLGEGYGGQRIRHSWRKKKVYEQPPMEQLDGF